MSSASVSLLNILNSCICLFLCTDARVYILPISAGTEKSSMFTMVSAIHALNDTTSPNDMYAGECQDPSSLNEDIVKGNLLICTYSVRFVLGLSTIKQALVTAKNLSAAGVVFYMDPFVIGFQLNPVPMKLPGIIIPSPDDSKVGFCINFVVFMCIFMLVCSLNMFYD